MTKEDKDMENNLHGCTACGNGEMGHEHSLGNTKVMKTSKRGDGCRVRVNGEDVEEVKQMKYLGITMNAEGNSEAEIEHRIGLHQWLLEQ